MMEASYAVIQEKTKEVENKPEFENMYSNKRIQKRT